MRKHVACMLVIVAALTLPSGAAAPVVNSARPSTPGPVGLYEKFELCIDLKATYANPFDPDEIDLWAEFTSPSGKVWKIWGFYNPSQGTGLWMVRFTPTEKGAWQYVGKVKDKEGTAQGQTG